MAIPFNLPSDEETEDNYRRLDQLLVDLYHVLRQILLGSRSSQISQSNGDDRGGGAPAPSGSRQAAADVTGSRRADLPDVVSSALAAAPSCACACQCPSRRRSQRRHRRRRRLSCCPSEHPQEPTMTVELSSCRSQRGVLQEAPRRVENWLIIGEQLRKIAEEFKTSFNKQEISKEKENNLKMKVKTSGLFSLLVPAHFRSSIWTTVILLVGWRLLVRSR